MVIEQTASRAGITDAQNRTFRYWVIAAGVYNLLAFVPMALPGLYQNYYNLNNDLNTALGLGGQPGVPPSEGINMLLVNLGGLVIVGLGFMLFYAARDLPHRWGIPVINALTRLAALGLLWYYVAVEDVARVMLLFGLVDILFIAVFLYYGAKMRGAASAG